MSCLGNTIARSLALVAVAGAISFMHWGFRPLTSLASPKGLADDQPAQTANPSDGSPAAKPGDQTSTEDQPATDPGDGAQPAAFDPSQLDTNITTEDAYQLWLMGTVTFIDAREAHDYEAGHIPYAVLVPAEGDRIGRLGDLLAATGIDASQRVVIYCEGGTCTASELVALDLQDMGFTKIHIDTDGFPAWQAAGYEVEVGPDMLLGDPG